MSDAESSHTPVDACVYASWPETEQARRRRWLLPLATGVSGLIAGAGVVGLAWGVASHGDKPAAQVTASASPSPSAASFNLTGTMTLNQETLQSGSCSGRGGYSDISDGTAVTVYDGGGQVVATGHLTAGISVGLACEFSVFVSGVPAGPHFYQVEVSHRGKVTVTAADARAGRFAATLG
ncbi:hypothetical protein [Kitasatospora sp. NPDC059571]|uniref:hypothetical protein n=1 Tax=Kitasatospora sp. NPDC059571 TaxID=3346871 RepID=UPI00369C722A